MSATNMYGTRLLSSTSSENDMEEVFMKPGVVGPPPTGGRQGVKSRCFSDPVFHSGVGKDSRLSSKTSALSDSSNVLSRVSSVNGQTEQLLKPSEIKVERCTPPPLEDDGIPYEGLDGVFPEPETLLQRAKDLHSFSALLEVDEDDNTLGEGHFPVDRTAELLNRELESQDTQNNSILPQDLLLNGTRNTSVLHQQNATLFPTGPAGDQATIEQADEGDEDDYYPEIEHFPQGYSCFPRGYDDDFLLLNGWQTPNPQRSFLRSGGTEFPQLPDNLFSTTNKEEFKLELDLVPLPPLPMPILSAETEMRLKPFLESGK